MKPITYRLFSWRSMLFKRGLRYLFAGVLSLFILSSCSREKKIFPEKTFHSSFTLGDYVYDVSFQPYFYKPRQVRELEELGKKCYGEIDISCSPGGVSGTDKYSWVFAVTDLCPVGDSGYKFNSVLAHENIPEQTEKKSRKKKKQKESSNIGMEIEMSVTLDPEANCYMLNLGQLFAGNATGDLEVAFPSGYNKAEVRQASNSILNKSLGTHFVLYPSKYLGLWVSEYEWLILAVVGLSMLLALLTGDWWSVPVIAVMTYLSLYTSYMVFLPVFPLILLIPLSYIPKFPYSEDYSFLIVGFLGIITGLFLLWKVYQGSTLWNTLLMAIIWITAIALYIQYLVGYVYSEKRRCSRCGRRIQRACVDSHYIKNGYDTLEHYIPDSDAKSCSATAMSLSKPSKEKEKICFHCKFN